jgi:hypothetical protein
MRKALIVTALAALAATPASAGASRQLHQSAASLNKNETWAPGHAVRAGKVVGEDPDARVRFELQRDNPSY